MKIKVKWLIMMSMGLFLVFATNLFSESSNRYEGKIMSIQEGGVKDAVIELQNNQGTFYINRGFEKFKIQELKSIIGRNAVVHTRERWTPLDPFRNGSRNIEILEVEEKVFFSITPQFIADSKYSLSRCTINYC